MAVDENAAAPIRLKARQPAQRRGLNTCGPKSDDRVDAFVTHHHVTRLHVGYMSSSAIVHAQSVELFTGLLLQIGGIGGENVRRAFEDEDLRHRWVDVAEVLRHIKFCDVADGARQFDAGWPSADDDEVERRVRAFLHHLPLCEFKGEQNTAADLSRVLDALQSGSELGPLVSSEVRVCRPGSNDQVVILQFDAGL